MGVRTFLGWICLFDGLEWDCSKMIVSRTETRDYAAIPNFISERIVTGA
jgi:hypothetical protein